MDSDLGFVTGFVNVNDSVFVVAASEQLEEEGTQHSFVAVWNNTTWTTWDQEFSIVTMDGGGKSHGRAAVLVGMYGDVLSLDADGTTSVERIGSGKNAPNQLRTISEVHAIGNAFYAVGMRRQVFRRDVRGG